MPLLAWNLVPGVSQGHVGPLHLENRDQVDDPQTLMSNCDLFGGEQLIFHLEILVPINYFDVFSVCCHIRWSKLIITMVSNSNTKQ
jgi:hypothetical protein